MKRSAELRLLVAAFGDPGHAFPAIALGRELASRGHHVVLETWERWREATEAVGLEFRAAEQYKVFPPPDPVSGDAGAADAAMALAPLLEELGPDLVVNDILTLAPALAAEVAGVPRATLIPHIYPVHEPGLPFFAVGVQPPRTPVGRWLWRKSLPLLETGLRIGREELNVQRQRLGLRPQARFQGGISEDLVMVGTFPQLEYPRVWPAQVTVTGPLHFELPYPDIELPEGDEPLVLVAPSTSQDPHNRLVRMSLEALAEEPVRVVATTNRMQPLEPIAVPGNAVLVDWLSYSQVMPQASVVVCHGGHGTVARALGEGVPVLVCPAVGDMAETAARVSWSRVGLSVPWRLCRPGPLRWAVRELLRVPVFRERARSIQRWSGIHNGARIAAELVEAQALLRQPA